MELVITPDQLQAAFLDGMWHGGLGVGLIVLGIFGWPATRYVLNLLFGESELPPLPPANFTIQDKYKDRHWARGLK